MPKSKLIIKCGTTMQHDRVFLYIGVISVRQPMSSGLDVVI